MSRRPAAFTQADIARAIRAAKQTGATEVEIRLGKAAVIVRLEGGNLNKLPDPEVEIQL
jgi:hypothetical protein